MRGLGGRLGQLRHVFRELTLGFLYRSCSPANCQLHDSMPEAWSGFQTVPVPLRRVRPANVASPCLRAVAPNQIAMMRLMWTPARPWLPLHDGVRGTGSAPTGSPRAADGNT